MLADARAEERGEESSDVSLSEVCFPYTYMLPDVHICWLTFIIYVYVSLSEVLPSLSEVPREGTTHVSLSEVRLLPQNGWICTTDSA